MDCIIDIKSLRLGAHKQEFKIDKSFFESYRNDTVMDACLDVMVVIDKAVGWIKVDCKITGDVKVECDRCLAELTLPIDISAPFTVKFSSLGDETDQDYGDDVIVLKESDGELDLSQIIYDYVCLSLPLKKVHPDGECDPVMMEKMKGILTN
jgi:uncharacterized protein